MVEQGISDVKVMEDLLAYSDTTLTWLAFVRNIAVGAVMAMVLERVYIRYGHSLSNRAAFARHFYLLAMTTTLIITVVQSSLALSLGLIGALSIVRFRSAIKEPEELVYIFLAVAVGLGLGANQLVLTVTAFVTIVGIIWLRHLVAAGELDTDGNLFLNVVTQDTGAVTIPALTKLLETHCQRVRFKRVDVAPSSLDASFLIEVDSLDTVQLIERELRQLDQGMTTTIVDNRTDAGAI